MSMRASLVTWSLLLFLKLVTVVSFSKSGFLLHHQIFKFQQLQVADTCYSTNKDNFHLSESFLDPRPLAQWLFCDSVYSSDFHFSEPNVIQFSASYQPSFLNGHSYRALRGTEEVSTPWLGSSNHYGQRITLWTDRQGIFQILKSENFGISCRDCCLMKEECHQVLGERCWDFFKKILLRILT